MQIIVQCGVPEASLEDMAMPHGLGARSKIAGIATCDPLHVRRKCFVRGRSQDEVKVIRHRAVAEEIDGKPARPRRH